MQSQGAGARLSHLLQEALWRWPEDLADADRLWRDLLAAATAGELPGQELRHWAQELSHARREDTLARNQILARGMRLLASLPAQAPPARARRSAGRRSPGSSPQGVPGNRVHDDPSPCRPGEEPLTTLRGCGPKTAQRLAERGLCRVEDLLGLLPLGYEDRRRLTPLSQLEEGRAACTTATVTAQRWLGRGRRRFFELVVEDDGARLLCRWFRTYPGLSSRFPESTRVWISGTPKTWRGTLQMAHPLVRELPDSSEEGPSDHTPEGLLPRYPTVEGVGPSLVRSLCAQAVGLAAESDPDPLDMPLRQELDLPTRAAALRAIHLPEPSLSDEAVEELQQRRSPAHRRLLFDELLVLQLGLALRRREIRDLAAPTFPPLGRGHLDGALPFSLTRAQARVLAEISEDLGRGEPMHRLVQGDVGSGKTAVAFGAAAQVMAGGGQVALMAPTEILAAEHAQTLAPWMKTLGHRLALLTSSTPRGARESTLTLLAAGRLPLVVGTHSLLADRVEFSSLGLIVVDEQHRFGVAQRARLRDKGVSEAGSPHLLVMTATPIPRTLALTAYGDLDLSVVDELPAGRTPARTHVFTARQRGKVYRRLGKLLDAGLRAFVVCPLVEASDKLDLANAERTHAELGERLAPHAVGLVHGRMGGEEKTAALEAFRRGELAVLVATTVVEVGVDIPEADIMVVESAQRFGLAQLHQLRGRVGRRAGSEPLCLLIADAGATVDARKRLQVMEETNDGFCIAEEDLAIRGPGELLGLRQAGESGLALSTAAANPLLLAAARSAARRLVDADPDLSSPAHQPIRTLLERTWGDRLFGEEAG